MLPPVLAVAGGIAMLWLATRTPSALVVDDYAQIEALTSERFARDREALRLGLSAVLDFDRDDGRVELALLAPAAFEQPESVILTIRHATDPSADRELNLAREGDRFTARAEFASGRYHVEVLPDDRSWRLAAGARWLDGELLLRPQVDGI